MYHDIMYVSCSILKQHYVVNFKHYMLLNKNKTVGIPNSHFLLFQSKRDYYGFCMLSMFGRVLVGYW